jgi:hypothetical protein
LDESTSTKSNFDPVYSRRPFNPLAEELLAESRMLDGGVSNTAGIVVESLHFCSRFDCRRG